MKRHHLLFAVALGAHVVTTASTTHASDKQACIDAFERGQLARDERRLIQARASFLLCASDDCPLVIRKDCSEWLDAVERRLPSVVVRARDVEGRDLVDVRVLVDGKPFLTTLDGRSVPIDPGLHVFRYEAGGREPIEERVLIGEAESSRLLAPQLREAAAAGPAAPGVAAGESPRPVPWMTFVLGGVAVLGASGFAFFASSATSDLSDLRGSCGRTQTCAQSDVDGVNRDLLVGNIALGVGLVAAAGALWTYLQRPQVQAPNVRAAGR